MRITILNGNPDADNKIFENYMQNLSGSIESNHSVTTLNLRDMDIRYCIGCFGCWVKTPGECSIKDDSHEVCRRSINSDLVLFASPVIMGFPSAVLKKAMDKMIPLVHPYSVIDQGEVHHLKRYKKYPKLGLILEKSGNTDDEDISIITDAFKRTAVNLKSRLYFSRLTSEPVEEVVDEINSL